MTYLASSSSRQGRTGFIRSSVCLALLGLCAAGLAQPATAQTAADIDRMLAEFDVQHQRTLQLIEEAKAALKPVSAWAHLPPDAPTLAPYLGKTLVSVESGFVMQVNGAEAGSSRVGFVNIDATPVGGFALGPKQALATEQYSMYDLQQVAFGDCPANGQPRSGSVNRDGSGVMFSWSCGGDRRGRGRQFNHFSLEPDGPGIKTTFLTINDQGVSDKSEHSYLPITEELVAAAALRLKERHEEEVRRQEQIRLAQAEEAREKRRADQERVRSFNRAMEGINDVLQGVAAENGTYEEAQARMDATVASIEASQASYPQAQAMTRPQAPLPQTDNRAQAMQDVPQADPRASDAAAGPSVDAAARPLRFVMSISMRNLPGDKVNPTCYSNIITRPGPPGWGGSGFLPQGSAEQAREAVYDLKSAFIAQCRASGREITSDGNFNFQMNQSNGDEERLQGMRARHSEDVSVSL